MIKAKVPSGEYATDSKVIRDGLRTLQARDSAVEKSLANEVAKAMTNIRKIQASVFLLIKSEPVYAPPLISV